MRIVWTAPALRDIAALRDYMAHHNPAAAVRQVQLIFAGVTVLSQFPESGRPGRRPGTRELVIARTPYVVPYRVRHGAVEVLRVLHGRQRWPELP